MLALMVLRPMTIQQFKMPIVTVAIFILLLLTVAAQQVAELFILLETRLFAEVCL
jgi:hypothetical protein